METSFQLLLMRKKYVGEGKYVGDRKNQECKEDRSQNGPHAEVGTSTYRPIHSVNLEPDLVHHNFLHFFLMQRL